MGGWVRFAELLGPSPNPPPIEGGFHCLCLGCCPLLGRGQRRVCGAGVAPNGNGPSADFTDFTDFLTASARCTRLASFCNSLLLRFLGVLLVFARDKPLQFHPRLSACIGGQKCRCSSWPFLCVFAPWRETGCGRSIRVDPCASVVAVCRCRSWQFFAPFAPWRETGCAVPRRGTAAAMRHVFTEYVCIP
jgi:hypothetical protein